MQDNYKNQISFIFDHTNHFFVESRKWSDSIKI